MELGRSYKQMAEMAAWKHLTGQLITLRDESIGALVRSDGSDTARLHEAEARATVKAIGSILRVAPYMIQEGKESERAFSQHRS